MTAGSITPAAATANYQWQSAATVGGTYTNISGATSNTYVLTLNEVTKYLRVIVTGINNYSGTQTSTESAKIAIGGPGWLNVGGQTWATTNLNVGTLINGVTAQTNNGGSNIVEKYCYSNIEANCISNGAFYQWDEAMGYVNTEGAQGICPAGSHIPSDNEWKTLEMSLSGMSQATADSTGYRGIDEGTKLKSGGSSGLNIPLAGNRNPDGSSVYYSTNAYLWSSSEAGGSAVFRHLYTSYATTYRYTEIKAVGFSVRCVGN